MRDGHTLQMLRWASDERTARAAMSYPLPIRATSPLPQFGEDGRDCGFDPQSWNPRVVQPASWPSATTCTPEQIIRQFRGGRYTQGLAMVAAWGRMWRQPNAVWGLRKIEDIERALINCAQNIRETQSVEHSWLTLTGLAEGQMGWTAVMTSKTPSLPVQILRLRTKSTCRNRRRRYAHHSLARFRECGSVRRAAWGLEGQHVCGLLQVHDGDHHLGRPA